MSHHIEVVFICKYASLCYRLATIQFSIVRDIWIWEHSSIKYVYGQSFNGQTHTHTTILFFIFENLSIWSGNEMQKQTTIRFAFSPFSSNNSYTFDRLSCLHFDPLLCGLSEIRTAKLSIISFCCYRYYPGYLRLSRSCPRFAFNQHYS